MLLEINSSISTFKPVRFRKGLNVLLADSAPTSTERQTRNSAGKSSLVEIIHFLFGSNCGKESLFRTAALIEHSFSAKVAFNGIEFEVRRAGSDPSKIFVDASREVPGLLLKADKESGRKFISNVNWRTYLGHEMFGLPLDMEHSPFAESFSPTFRSLFSYFARRRNSGGFQAPEMSGNSQQRWDWQTNLSYLLGLDWQIASELQRIRAREKTLEELKKSAKDDTLGNIIGTVAGLRPQVSIAENQTRRLREQVSKFEILDSYRELAQRAASTRIEMQSLNRESVQARERLEYLQEAWEIEKPPAREFVEKIYGAAGVELPDVALRRLEEVSGFFDSVVENRKMHLNEEIEATIRLIKEIDMQIEALGYVRQSILGG